MNQDQDHKGNFEDRLLAELRAVVAGREPARSESEGMNLTPAWRRGPRLALAGGAVTAVAAAVLIVGAGGNDTPAAYAVTHQDDGKLGVEIRSLGDPEGLAQALDAAGVPADVEYVPAAEACGFAPTHRVEVTEAVPTVPAEAAHLTIDPGEVGPGETLVLTAAPAGEGIAVETKVAETLPRSAEGESTEPAEDGSTKPAEGGGGDADATCGVPAEASAGVQAVPTVPAESADEAGAPAAH